MKLKHENFLRTIFDRDFVLINLSSFLPDQIIDRLKKLKLEFGMRSVVISNTDVWRYGGDEKLLDFLKNDGRRFYLLTLGYNNKKISDNILELSWPWFYLNRPKNDIVPMLNKTCQFGYSCLNNNSSFHRLILGHQLWINNLTKDMIFTQNLTNLPKGYYQGLLDGVPLMRDYISSLPISWSVEVTNDFVNDHTINHPAYIEAYCNIATESEIQNFIFDGSIIDLPIITEKSYKPFRSMQIPVWFAAPEHIAYLKSLGFETMEDILPQEYDKIDMYTKVQSILDLIKKGFDSIKIYYHDHHRELQHNYDLIQSDAVDDLITNNLKSFIQHEI